VLVVAFEYDRTRRKEIEKKQKEEVERQSILDQAAKEREVGQGKLGVVGLGSVRVPVREEWGTGASHPSRQTRPGPPRPDPVSGIPVPPRSHVGLQGACMPHSCAPPPIRSA
jgi:hypothetical protein